MISIVAPNRNEMPYFKDLFLRSLSEQTFKDFELIIVDAGSEDGSLEALMEYVQIFHEKGIKHSIMLICDQTRNIGYIRNVGAKAAKGEIIFETSSDCYFPPDLLRQVHNWYHWKPTTICLSGRTFPMGSKISLFSHVGYQVFDFLRYLLTTRIMPIKKIRPSGNFLTIRRKVLEEVGWYPEVTINEDGLLGCKIDEYIKREPSKRSIKEVCFHLKFYVGHHVKRFEKKGGLGAILFYFYIFGIIFPMLRPLLKPIESRSAQEFMTRTDLRETPS